MTLDGAAKEAWALMVRAKNPMPPAVALDYVIDRTDGRAGTRRECARLLSARLNVPGVASTITPG